MDGVYVDLRYSSDEVKEEFPNQDLVTIEELIGTIEELKERIHNLENEEENEDYYEDFKLGLLS